MQEDKRHALGQALFQILRVWDEEKPFNCDVTPLETAVVWKHRQLDLQGFPARFRRIVTDVINGNRGSLDPMVRNMVFANAVDASERSIHLLDCVGYEMETE